MRNYTTYDVSIHNNPAQRNIIYIFVSYKLIFSLYSDHFLFTETRTNQHLHFFPEAITLINTDTSLTSFEQSLKPLHLITHTLTVYLYDLNEQLSQESVSVLHSMYILKY